MYKGDFYKGGVMTATKREVEEGITIIEEITKFCKTATFENTQQNNTHFSALERMHRHNMQ